MKHQEKNRLLKHKKMENNNQNSITAFAHIHESSAKNIANEWIYRLENGLIGLEEIVLLQKVNKATQLFVSSSGTKKFMLDEIEKNSGSQQLFGCEVKAANIYTKYDYSNCGDPYYDAILEVLKRLENARKNREQELKNIPEGKSRNILIEYVPVLRFEESGEVVKISAPSKLITRGVKIMHK